MVVLDLQIAQRVSHIYFYRCLEIDASLENGFENLMQICQPGYNQKDLQSGL